MGKKIIQGTLEVIDGIELTNVSGATIGGDKFGGELVSVMHNCNILASSNDIFIRVNDEQLKLYKLAEPTNDSDAATKQYVDLVNLESQIKVKRFI